MPPEVTSKGGYVEIPIVLDEAGSVFSLSLQIEFNPDSLEINVNTDLVLGELFAAQTGVERWHMESYQSPPGLFRIALYCATTSLEGKATVATMRFKVKDTSIGSEVSILAYNSPDGVLWNNPDNCVVKVGGEVVARDVYYDDDYVSDPVISTEPLNHLHYKTYFKGVTDVTVDIHGASDIMDEDFEFMLGDNGLFSSVANPVVKVIEGGGQGGSDRVCLTWEVPLMGEWLKVVVKANENTNLAVEDVFYVQNRCGLTCDG
jgi:hypothetical protein